MGSIIPSEQNEGRATATPCTTCGACCAYFRVSFYWGEIDAFGLPDDLVEQAAPFTACMRGTKSAPARCVALAGHVGEAAHCAVYERRPSPCRELQPGAEKCLRARAAHGLAPP